jgi:hypothetical protein
MSMTSSQPNPWIETLWASEKTKQANFVNDSVLRNRQEQKPQITLTLTADLTEV